MNSSDLDAFFESYAAAWAANDSDRIASHWDADDPNPFYKAEEVPDYFHDLDEIKAYWKQNERFHDAIRLRFSEMKTRPLPDGYLMVFLRMRWDIRFATDAQRDDGTSFAHAGKSMGGENHVLALVHQKNTRLALVGWSETPDAPISYMRRLYEWVADPDLDG